MMTPSLTHKCIFRPQCVKLPSFVSCVRFSTRVIRFWICFNEYFYTLSLEQNVQHSISSNAFSWMKSFVFWFKFHLRLFPWLTICQHYFRQCLSTKLMQYWGIPTTSYVLRQNDRHLQTHFQMYFLDRNVLCFDSNFIKVNLKVFVDNNSALIQIMAWHRRGDKPLPGAMTDYFTDADMRHSVSPPILYSNWINSMLDT